MNNDSKSNSVCKHCHKKVQIVHLFGEQYWSHVPDAGYKFDGTITYDHVAEPAEPSMKPMYGDEPPSEWERTSAEPTAEGSQHETTDCLHDFGGYQMGTYKGHFYPAAPQPVAGEGPQECRRCRYTECPHGKCPMCDWPCKICKAAAPEGTPKLEEIALDHAGHCVVCRRAIRCEYKHVKSGHDETCVVGKILSGLRPFITPACSPPNSAYKTLREDLGNVECASYEQARRINVALDKFEKTLKLATPVSTGEVNGWVSVEERLPEPNAAIYFILRESGERHIGKMLDLATSFWSHDFHKFYAPQEVSHWIMRHVPPAPTSVPQAEPKGETE